MKPSFGARPEFQPIEGFPVTDRRKVRAVLTDIDDTLTESGRLPAVAYQALENLHEAGLFVIPVTARPAGWCDMIARQWPVDGVVGENGAFYFRYEQSASRMIRKYMKSSTERANDRKKLDNLQSQITSQVPGAAIASDQAYREADLAIDFAEDVPLLPPNAVNRIVEIFEQQGATAKVSSIHVNGWFGGYDKLTTSLRMLFDEFGIDAAANREAIVFAGDSPNDAPMFDYFPNSVGVANVIHFKNSLPVAPTWITTKSGGQGFAELAGLLLKS